MAVFIAAVTLGGCQFFPGSFETVATLDKEGKNAQAIEAYQTYLSRNPSTSLAAHITYRIAKNFEAESDYTNALHWYEKVLSDYPQTDEELHALLDLAALYQDKLKNSAKAAEYAQRAFNRYTDNSQIRDVLQSLIEAKYQTANAMFTEKNYKNASDALEGIYKNYPAVFLSPDTRAKVDSLADRSRRALEIAKASVDLISLRSEVPFTKNFDSDFSLAAAEEKTLPSPDGKYLAERKMAPNGVYYLYVAKAPAKDGEARFNLVRQTFGADKPTWSPDGKELVYWRTTKRLRKLEKTDVKTMATQTLFYTKSNSLGIHPAFHPAGNKIAYVYENRVTLINIGDNFDKQLLKTNQKLDYTADLSWSNDGTMIRCRQTDKHGRPVDELLVLDVSASNNP
jgi:tetratricopeptide (TPR) repeat protein